MTVSDLIQKLKNANPNAEVVVEVMDVGLSSVENISFLQSDDPFFEDIDVEKQVPSNEANVVFLS